MDVTYASLNVFSDKKDKGNPAAVLTEGERYTEQNMQELANIIGFNETVFILSSRKNDYRLRFFSPKSEMPLCGHATLAASYVLLQNKPVNSHISFETLVGEIRVSKVMHNQKVMYKMKQKTAQFISFVGDEKKLAGVLGIPPTAIDKRWPIMYGGTGSWTLLVPIISREKIKQMLPNNQAFPEILTQQPSASIHPFCLDTILLEADMYGRHFSSAFAGTTEDSVTGTASGVMGAYYQQYMDNNKASFIVEQGYELQKEGVVHVLVEDGLEVSIMGEVTFVKENKIIITKSSY